MRPILFSISFNLLDRVITCWIISFLFWHWGGKINGNLVLFAKNGVKCSRNKEWTRKNLYTFETSEDIQKWIEFIEKKAYTRGGQPKLVSGLHLKNKWNNLFCWIKILFAPFLTHQIFFLLRQISFFQNTKKIWREKNLLGKKVFLLSKKGWSKKNYRKCWLFGPQFDQNWVKSTQKNRKTSGFQN